MTSDPDPFLADVETTYGRIAYTHKTHEKQAEIDEDLATKMKITNIAVLSVSALLALLAPLLNSTTAAVSAAIGVFIGLALAFVQLSFDPAKDAAAHRVAAKEFLALRNDYQQIVADIQTGAIPVPDLRERRDVLAARLQTMNKMAPQTSPAAYEKARAALKTNEELTFTAGELDQLLPPDRSRRNKLAP